MERQSYVASIHARSLRNARSSSCYVFVCDLRHDSIALNLAVTTSRGQARSPRMRSTSPLSFDPRKHLTLPSYAFRCVDTAIYTILWIAPSTCNGSHCLVPLQGEQQAGWSSTCILSESLAILRFIDLKPQSQGTRKVTSEHGSTPTGTVRQCARRSTLHQPQGPPALASITGYPNAIATYQLRQRSRHKPASLSGLPICECGLHLPAHASANIACCFRRCVRRRDVRLHALRKQRAAVR